MEAQKFVGWIERIIDGEYEVKFSVTNSKDEVMAKQLKAAKSWPTTLMFSMGKRSGCAAQFVGYNVGDKVEVKYFLSGKSGISKRTGQYYCVNSLNVAKTQGVTCLERASVSKSDESPEPDFSDDDSPF